MHLVQFLNHALFVQNFYLADGQKSGSENYRSGVPNDIHH